METDKYIELTHRICLKYNIISLNGCGSDTCPLKNLECGDFMRADSRSDALEICRRVELVLRKEFPKNLGLRSKK